MTGLVNVMGGLDWECDVWFKDWIRECYQWIRVVVNGMGGLVNMMCGLESGFVNVMSRLDREGDEKIEWVRECDEWMRVVEQETDYSHVF